VKTHQQAFTLSPIRRPYGSGADGLILGEPAGPYNDPNHPA